MTLSGTREFTITTSGGQVIILTKNDKLEQATTMTVVCDSPKCAGRHNTPEPVTITWVEEKVQTDANALPEEFDQLVKMTIDPREPKELSFCGRQCAIDFLVYAYQPPKSRRQIKQEQTEKLAELNPHLKAPADGATCTENGLPSADDLDAVAREQEIAAVPQADGDPGDCHE